MLGTFEEGDGENKDEGVWKAEVDRGDVVCGIGCVGKKWEEVVCMGKSLISGKGKKNGYLSAKEDG